MHIDIAGLDKGRVVAALWNRAQTQGMGLLHVAPAQMTPEEGQVYADRYLDYLKGRVMKVDLRGETLNQALYDRDHGEGAAAEVIATLRREAHRIE